MIALAAAFFAAALPGATVLQPVVNMYSKPTDDADVVSQAIYGVNVGILEQKDGWARIRTPDDYTGWTPLAAIRTGAPYASQGRVAQVVSMFAHIYREPSVTRHAPLITVPFETHLEVATDKPAAPADTRWLQVRLVDGRSGFIQSGDVALDRTPISTPEMLALSRKFLGVPYTWGGTSSYGYDCSGFMQMLERQHGVLMPRDAQPQAEWKGVKPVLRQNLEPGDLLYFGSSEKHITHTGMYLGDGKFINATTYITPMVRIDDLGDPHWVKLLVAARRVK
ncbi:MAG TPA: C40 family peptidase [Bryobacteraceae bacterium]|nr:C40 family peptidase [Bryobacteraceae bacterium]